MKRGAVIELPRFVPFIDGAMDGWPERARHCLLEGFNFFVLVRPGAEEALSDVLSVPLISLPPIESTATLLSSSRFVDPSEFRLPQQTEHGKERVYHIEQLWLPQTRPPEVKPYLLYCYVRGIVAQHDLAADARVSCDHYNNDRFTRGQFPEAAVYRWEQDEWRRTRLC